MMPDPQAPPLEPPTPTTVAIVEDDPQFRAAFEAIVAASPALALAGSAADLAGGLQLAGRLRADVWLIDLGLPDGSGIELIRHLARHRPEADVMVVTVFGDDRHVFPSLEAGATGYLLKESLPTEFVDCILMLRAGGSPISPTIARRVIARLRGDATTPSGAVPPGALGAPAESAPVVNSPLTSREAEILQLVSKGLGFAEIGGVVGVSTHTVTSHVKNIYRKLAVHSRGEAVFEARQLGLLGP